jgi:RNA polymerase sigma-70 factor (family 1)
LPASQPYEEKELLLRITKGDEKAFHTLYQHYFGKVYAMCLHYLANVVTAQDIVQEVFSRIWLKRSELPSVLHFEAWLITVTRNLLINELRKAHPAGGEPSDTAAANPHETIDYRELEKLLQEAVNGLSPRQQQVYRLSRTGGYSHKEIAAQLGISVDVSREHLSKALHAIRAFLLKRYGPLGILVSLAIYFFLTDTPHACCCRVYYYNNVINGF